VRTLAELIDTTGVDVLDYLDRQASVPVLREPQIQGDVSFLPVTTKAATKPIPATGVVVATGRGGHDHRLVGVGFFDFAPAREGSVTIGTLTVPADTEVYAAHDEHGFMGFAPGTYSVGRQREQADVIREVED
jgi:hypothetical protein